MYCNGWAVKNEDIPDIFAFYGDFWKLLKATYNIPANNTKEYCDYLVNAGNVLVSKYKGTNAGYISEQFVLAYIEDINERVRRMK